MKLHWLEFCTASSTIENYILSTGAYFTVLCVSLLQPLNKLQCIPQFYEFFIVFYTVYLFM